MRHVDRSHVTHDGRAVQRLFDITDKQIDNMVYERYDQDDDEIRIVEEDAKS